LATLGVIILAFWLDIVNGLMKTSIIVFDDGYGKIANWLAEKIGL